MKITSNKNKSKETNERETHKTLTSSDYTSYGNHLSLNNISKLMSSNQSQYNSSIQYRQEKDIKESNNSEIVLKRCTPSWNQEKYNEQELKETENSVNNEIVTLEATNIEKINNNYKTISKDNDLSGVTNRSLNSSLNFKENQFAKSLQAFNKININNISNNNNSSFTNLDGVVKRKEFKDFIIISNSPITERGNYSINGRSQPKSIKLLSNMNNPGINNSFVPINNSKSQYNKQENYTDRTPNDHFVKDNQTNKKCFKCEDLIKSKEKLIEINSSLEKKCIELIEENLMLKKQLKDTQEFNLYIPQNNKKDSKLNEEVEVIIKGSTNLSNNMFKKFKIPLKKTKETQFSSNMQNTQKVGNLNQLSLDLMKENLIKSPSTTEKIAADPSNREIEKKDSMTSKFKLKQKSKSQNFEDQIVKVQNEKLKEIHSIIDSTISANKEYSMLFNQNYYPSSNKVIANVSFTNTNNTILTANNNIEKFGGNNETLGSLEVNFNKDIGNFNNVKNSHEGNLEIDEKNHFDINEINKLGSINMEKTNNSQIYLSKSIKNDTSNINKINISSFKKTELPKSLNFKYIEDPELQLYNKENFTSLNTPNKHKENYDLFKDELNFNEKLLNHKVFYNKKNITNKRYNNLSYFPSPISKKNEDKRNRNNSINLFSSNQINNNENMSEINKLYSNRIIVPPNSNTNSKMTQYQRNYDGQNFTYNQNINLQNNLANSVNFKNFSNYKNEQGFNNFHLNKLGISQQIKNPTDFYKNYEQYVVLSSEGPIRESEIGEFFKVTTNAN